MIWVRHWVSKRASTPLMVTEMPDRRTFITGAAAVGIAPSSTWADVGNPNYLSAAKMRDGSFLLFGLDADVRPLFSLPLPGRGHAAAGHPNRPEAVAFARRPGTFAMVLDCARGTLTTTLVTPPERHFYGHGVFSEDGSRLFTTENAFEIGEGRIGIWAADDGYRRIGEFWSGGVGPHDIARLPGSDMLVVANGGIDTHPDTGREKLNIPTMRPNLAYITGEGAVLDRVELQPEMHKSSIRHLAVRSDATVCFGCQWQGDLSDVPPLIGMHRLGEAAKLLRRDDPNHRALNGYVGSIAFSRDGAVVGFTAPRGGRAEFYDIGAAVWGQSSLSDDVCGIAPGKHGHVVTTGLGASGHAGEDPLRTAIAGFWDNHLVEIAPV